MAVLLAGLPGYVRLYVTTPSRSEVELLRERQNVVLQRLAAIDIRLNTNDLTFAELRTLIQELQRLQR